MKSFQCRMARAALDWSTQKLAAKAGVGVNTVNRFEVGQDARMSSVEKMRAALEAAGIVFLSTGEMRDGGPGVRLKKQHATDEGTPAAEAEHFTDERT